VTFRSSEGDESEQLLIPLLRTLTILRPPSKDPRINLRVYHCGGLAATSSNLLPDRAEALSKFTAIQSLKLALADGDAYGHGADDDGELSPVAVLCETVRSRCPRHEHCYKPPPLDMSYAEAVAAGYNADAKSTDCVNFVRCATCERLTMRSDDVANRERTCTVTGVTFCFRCSGAEGAKEQSTRLWCCSVSGCKTVALHEALSVSERKGWVERGCNCGSMCCENCPEMRHHCRGCGSFGCPSCVRGVCPLCQKGDCNICDPYGEQVSSAQMLLELCHVCQTWAHPICARLVKCPHCPLAWCGACAKNGPVASQHPCAGLAGGARPQSTDRVAGGSAMAIVTSAGVRSAGK
jgi:hypothetical protein